MTRVVLLAAAGALALLVFIQTRGVPSRSASRDAASARERRSSAGEAKDAPAADPVAEGTGRVSVLVVDQDGRAVFAAVASAGEAQAITNAEGRATLEMPLPGRLRVQHADAEAVGVPVSRPGEIRVALDLAREGRGVAGILLAPDGVTRVEGRVLAEPLAPDAVGGFVAFAEGGGFRFRGLPEGRYRLSVHPKEPGAGFTPLPPPVVRAGDAGVRLVLAPAVEVRVTLVERGTSLPADGQCDVVVVRDGRAEVSVRARERLGPGPRLLSTFVDPRRDTRLKIRVSDYEEFVHALVYPPGRDVLEVRAGLVRLPDPPERDDY